MWRKQQRFSNYNTPGTPSGLLQAFAITSDPQYPWTPCSDNSFNPSCPEDDNTKYRVSEGLIREQYNDINNYMNSLPSDVNRAVLINGDVTAYGHNDPFHPQWSKMNTLMNTLSRPYYFGLGNHDLDNDCYNQGCFKNSLNFLIEHVQKRGIPSNRFDYTKTFIGVGRGYRHAGSFAYSFDIGNICFIQLQYDDKWSREVGGSITGNIDTYSIYPNVNWFENQLRMAKAEGKIIIVNIHNSINTLVYQDLIDQYGVVACFSGHFHNSLGLSSSFGNALNFRSGSASQRTYLILEQYTDGLEIYTVRNNDWGKRKWERTISISTQLPIFSGRYQIVTALNDSSVLDLNNMGNPNNVTLWSNNSGNNQKWDFNLNGPTQAYSIRSVSNPNLVLAWNDYQNSRNVFATPFISGYDEHLWVLERGDIGFIFRNRKNRNLVLDVQNGNTSNGTNIQVHERHPVGSPYRRAQEFQLRKMN